MHRPQGHATPKQRRCDVSRVTLSVTRSRALVGDRASPRATSVPPSESRQTARLWGCETINGRTVRARRCALASVGLRDLAAARSAFAGAGAGTLGRTTHFPANHGK